MLFPGSWCSGIGHYGAGKPGPNQDKEAAQTLSGTEEEEVLNMRCMVRRHRSETNWQKEAGQRCSE